MHLLKKLWEGLFPPKEIIFNSDSKDRLYRIKYIGPVRREPDGTIIPHRIGGETLDPFGYFSYASAKSLVKNSPTHFEWADKRPQ